MKKAWIALLLIPVILTSCGILPGASANDLEGTAWTLTSYGGGSLIPDSAMTAHFKDGEVSGSASCNRYFGGYKIKGDQIQIDGLGWTEMACMDPEGIMSQEQELMDLLSRAESFSWQGNVLLITAASGEVLTFSQIEARTD